MYVLLAATLPGSAIGSVMYPFRGTKGKKGTYRGTEAFSTTRQFDRWCRRIRSRGPSANRWPFATTEPNSLTHRWLLCVDPSILNFLNSRPLNMASHVVRVSLAMHLVIGECDMKRFAWWRMEQDTHHLSRALCGAFCSILHHVKHFMSQPPEFFTNLAHGQIFYNPKGEFLVT